MRQIFLFLPLLLLPQKKTSVSRNRVFCDTKVVLFNGSRWVTGKHFLTWLPFCRPLEFFLTSTQKPHRFSKKPFRIDIHVSLQSFTSLPNVNVTEIARIRLKFCYSECWSLSLWPVVIIKFHRFLTFSVSPITLLCMPKYLNHGWINYKESRHLYFLSLDCWQRTL